MTCGYLPIGLCVIHPLAAAAEQLNEARTRMGCAATSSQLTLAAADLRLRASFADELASQAMI
ncbi:hypothetical protein X760_32285 [Mesorhizobium sp. LSHC422A00]|nr:hypothetical protein X762_31215 [Mesorhizobium sp. LSHC426A00]ESX47406.1 hypothetical protein X761_30125 [Mesorhizobium sp. LSHC424B00]ESX49729.1 hypothetical protein X760_32285 [Mesorhizobium sp. LSHC422A00]ESX64049.1 hypothetical protein X758_32435 [Mesorhizobium sp. LSHC416B00]